MKHTKSELQYSRFSSLRSELCSVYHETIRNKLNIDKHLESVKNWRARRETELKKLPRYMLSELNGIHHAMFNHIQVMEVCYVHVFEGIAYRSCLDNPKLNSESFEAGLVRSGHVWGNVKSGTVASGLILWGELLTEKESNEKTKKLVANNSNT